MQLLNYLREKWAPNLIKASWMWNQVFWSSETRLGYAPFTTHNLFHFLCLSRWISTCSSLFNSGASGTDARQHSWPSKWHLVRVRPLDLCFYLTPNTLPLVSIVWKITLTLVEALEQKHSWLLQGNSFLMKVLTYLKPEKLRKIQN